MGVGVVQYGVSFFELVDAAYLERPAEDNGAELDYPSLYWVWVGKMVEDAIAILTDQVDFDDFLAT